MDRNNEGKLTEEDCVNFFTKAWLGHKNAKNNENSSNEGKLYHIEF